MKVQDYIKKAKIRHDHFPRRFQAFLYADIESGGNSAGQPVTNASTLDLECQGQVLLAGNRVGVVADVIPFVENVLAWMGKNGPRTHSMMFNGRQTDKKIAEGVEKSSRYLQAGDLARAIEIIDELDGVDIPAGSKILRMLSPRQAAACSDSLRKTLRGYRWTSAKRHEGYASFCADCKKVADALPKKGVRNPYRIGGAWYAADVEAVVFHDVYRQGK